MDTYLQAAHQLHRYLVETHWDGQVIAGPDPIGKIHWRLTRFVRSYMPWLPNDDRWVYLQAQTYWIHSNMHLYHLTQDPQYLTYVEACADYIVANQPEDGGWIHPPIPGRVGFVSTVEGAWAALGLTAAYQQLGKESHLAGAIKWYAYQVNQSGFQETENDGLAANYYSHSENKVPNVTTMTIWLTGELFKATGDKKYLEYTERMLKFVAWSQLKSGELPYALDRVHFMCYQYNSFQFIDLVQYYRITGDALTYSIIHKMAQFLATGVTERGSCRHNCFKDLPEIHYWTAVIGAALRMAHQLKLGDYMDLSERAYTYLLAQQNKTGGFNFSEGDYKGLLHDHRSYPRGQAMILRCLLYRLADVSEIAPDPA